MRRLSSLRPVVLSTVIAAVAVGYSPFLSAARSSPGSPSPDSPYGHAGTQSGLRAVDIPQAYIVEARTEGSLFLSATSEEAELMARRVPDSTMHVITPGHKGLSS